MAFTDFTMGPVDPYAGETEEERRRRLAEEALNTPVKQTIVTNPDGSQEMTIKGTPEALSSANPNTPTVTQPVAPDESAAETQRLAAQAQAAAQQQAQAQAQQQAQTRAVPAVPDIGTPPTPGPGVQVASINPSAGFDRMLQVESGNRDYTASGAPVTSPKGAMFAAQVMPATAAAPGFGVKPAAAQTPEEYNRVGREYYDAMLKKYGGNQDLARAAYNAGPGRVDQAIAQARAQGVDPMTLLPRETQNYVQKTAAPVAPTMPQPGPPVQVASTAPGLPATQPAAAPAAAPTFESRFTDAATDPMKLLQLADDKAISKEQQLIARRQASELLNRQVGETRGREQLATMSETDIARMLKSKSEEGSWAKMILLGFISPELAGREAAKLGLKDQWSTGLDADGKPVLLKTRDGVPIEGVSGETGKSLSPKELIAASAQAVAIKGANATSQVYRDPLTQETLTKVDTPQGPIYYNKSRQRVVPKGEPVPLTAGSDISTQLQLSQMRRQQQFVGQTAAARLQSYKEVNNERALANLPPLTPEQMGINANGELIGQAQPQVPGLATPAPAAAPAGSVAGPAVPGTAATGQAPIPAAPAPAAAPAATPVQTSPALQQRVAAAQQNMPAPAGQTPAQMQAARLAAAAGQKTEATKTAEVLVADREALPKIESSAENTLATLKDVLTHPGFTDVIGVPNVITGIWSPPGTDARNFKSKYEQLKGQQFLEAFNSLRGGGSITEVEGLKAEQAIAALRDPGISESEFKRNAKILEDTIKRGVNKAREKVGQPPKYQLDKEAEPAKKANTPAVGTTSVVGGVTYVWDGKGWKKK